MSSIEQILSTALGSFFGFISGIFVFLFTNWLKFKKARLSYKKLLNSEFSHIYRIIKQGTPMGINFSSGLSEKVLITYIQTLVAEKAALS